jgi:hypothetical protein
MVDGEGVKVTGPMSKGVGQLILLFVLAYAGDLALLLRSVYERGVSGLALPPVLSSTHSSSLQLVHAVEGICADQTVLGCACRGLGVGSVN